MNTFRNRHIGIDRRTKYPRRFWPLSAQMAIRLERRMMPIRRGKPVRHYRLDDNIRFSCALVWRTELARKIWNNASDYSGSGYGNGASQMGYLNGYWPWETAHMTWDEVLALPVRRRG